MDRHIVFFTASEGFGAGTKRLVFRDGSAIFVNFEERIPAGSVGMARRSERSCHGIDVCLAPALPACQPVLGLNGRGTRGLIKACLQACYLRPLAAQRAA